MNKKSLALLLIIVMLLAVGCGNDVDTEETIQPSQSLETESNVEIPDETIPGAVSAEKPLRNPLDETQDAEQKTAWNNGFIDNTDNSNSGGNGQSDTGNNNTGNSSNQGSNNNGNANGGSNAEKPTQSGDNAATDPQPTESKPTEPSSEIEYVSYEEYNNMPPAEQVAYYNQFPSMEAFVEWYNEAKAAYNAEHASIDLGDGNIDLEDIINP